MLLTHQVITAAGGQTAWSDKEYGTYQLYRGKDGRGESLPFSGEWGGLCELHRSEL